MKTHDWDVGQRIHGFAGGAFGRDSYTCRTVEAVGADWVVTRNDNGWPEFVSGIRIPSQEVGDDRAFCDDGDPDCSWG